MLCPSLSSFYTGWPLVKPPQAQHSPVGQEETAKGGELTMVRMGSAARLGNGCGCQVCLEIGILLVNILLSHLSPLLSPSEGIKNIWQLRAFATKPQKNQQGILRASSNL